MKINKLIINSVLFPILLTPSLTSCSYKEQNLKLDFHNIQEKMNETIKANIEKFNLYTNHDRKIIFNQDNTPKWDEIITIKDSDISKNIFNQDTEVTTNYIALSKFLAFPFDFLARNYDKNKEIPNQKKFFENYFNNHHRILMSNQFKHYIGYKNDLLYNAPITKKILSGNQLEKNYDKYIEYIRKSSKIINEPVYDWWLAFNDDFNYKNLLSFEPYSNDKNLLKNKLYFVFNAPVLVLNNWWDDIEESTEIFGWYPEIKDGRLLFSRIIKNQKLDKIKTDFLNFPSHISRHIAMKSYIFDLDKLVLNLGINLNKFNIEEHIRINFNKIYKNFDNELPKNSISKENDLIKLLKNNGISNRQYNFWKQQIDNLDDESLLNKFLFEKYLIVPN